MKLHALVALVVAALSACMAGSSHAQRSSAFATAESGRFVLNSVTAVNLDPLTIPMAGTGRIRQQIYITIGIDAVDVAAAERMRAVRPRVIDAVVYDLYQFANANPRQDPDLNPQTLERIKTIIADAAERIVGPGHVREVALGEARPVAVY